MVRPILFSIGNFYVGSYAAMMFIAVLIAIVSTFIRARKRAVDTSFLAPVLTVGLICGWLLSRASQLIDPVARSAGWRVFSPMQGGGGSLTYFGIGAALGLVVFLLVRRQPVIVFADVIAPSILFAVGIAKIGCLMSGCCEGAVCSNAFGITYPYGSSVHEHHLARGLVRVPDDLKRVDPDPNSVRRTLGHMQILQYESAFAEQNGSDEKNGATPELVARAAGHRSMTVWPVPILTSIAAIVCGIAAEVIYRKSKRPGVTFAFVLCAYGAIRLTLDWLLAERSYVHYGLSAAQWIGLFALLAGMALYIAKSRSIELNSE